MGGGLNREGGLISNFNSVGRGILEGGLIERKGLNRAFTLFHSICWCSLFPFPKTLHSLANVIASLLNILQI